MSENIIKISTHVSESKPDEILETKLDELKNDVKSRIAQQVIQQIVHPVAQPIVQPVAPIVQPVAPIAPQKTLKEVYITLPSGTKFKASHRAGRFSMTLVRDTCVLVKKNFDLLIDNTPFSVNVSETSDCKCQVGFALPNHPIFKLEKLTEYYVNCEEIDPLGLTNVLDFDQDICIEHGSRIVLRVGTTVNLNRSGEFAMILAFDTQCII